MHLTTAPLLLDALVFAPRDMPLETLSSAVVHALLRQLRAARRAASRWCRPSGPAEPGGAGRAAGGAGAPQGLSVGQGALAAHALHFQPGALAHPVTVVLPLPPLGAEVRSPSPGKLCAFPCTAQHTEVLSCSKVKNFDRPRRRSLSASL